MAHVKLLGLLCVCVCVREAVRKVDPSHHFNLFTWPRHLLLSSYC